MFIVLGFYKLKKLNFLKKKKTIIQNFFINHNVRGTLIISKEGVNGTISVNPTNVSLIKKKIKSLFQIKTFDNENLSKSKFQPFYKPKVKIKNEVVPMGLNIISQTKKKKLFKSNRVE